MSLDPLDNPGWHALNSHHSHLAIRGEVAARYPPDIFIGAGMPENNPSGFDDLRSLVAKDEVIGVIGVIPEDLSGWQVLQVGQTPQLVCESLKPAPRVDAFPLTAEDVPEMLALVDLSQPGPFLPRTIEMGRYLGFRQDGQLVAMAGERMHLRGFCEISAVSTHPDYRGRGYGGALTTMVAEAILERQETPFLHVASGNEAARRLYLKLGFRLRTEVQINILKRLAG
jgi:predicted GNAT family acetyltransferase